MRKRVISLLLVLTLVLPCLICFQVSAREVTESRISTSAYNTLLSDMYKAVKAKNDGVTPSINIKKSDINFTKLYSDFVEKYPDCFYLSQFDKVAYTSDQNQYIALITFEYICSKSQIDTKIKEFNAAIQKYVDSIDSKWSNIQKVLYVHDRIIMESTYDIVGAENPDKRKPASTSAYGVMVNHTGVCESYSLAFLTIMNKVGISCKRVRSEEVGGIGHVWNLVKVNGSWYHIDLTFDDPSNLIRCSHKYTLLTDKELRAIGDHGNDWGNQTSGVALNRKTWSYLNNPIYEVNGKFYSCTSAKDDDKGYGRIIRFNSDLTQATQIYKTLNLITAVGRCHTHVIAIGKTIYQFTDEDTKSITSNAVDSISASYVNMLQIDYNGKIVAVSPTAKNTPIRLAKIGQIAKKHEYTYKTITASTCYVKGKQKATCEKCGYEETQDMALAHVPVTIPGKAATHTKTGLSSGTKCKVCGKIIKKQTVLPTTGHKFGKTGTVTRQPTCIKEGIRSYKCTLPNCNFVKTEKIEKVAHKPVKLKAVAATCSSTGLTEGSKCSVCNKIIVAQKKIDTTDHTPSSQSTIIRGTSTSIAYVRSNLCTVCKEPCNTQVVVTSLFADVPTGSWYQNSVYYCVAYGLFGGMGGNNFAPLNSLTREQFMQVLFNFAGEDKNKWSGSTGFNDAPAGQWYSPAIKWARVSGVTNGMGGGNFGLGVQISREQFASLLMNYASSCGLDVSKKVNLKGYSDFSEVSSWAVNGLQWAVAEGIISGTSATMLSPKMIANRATATMIFMNFQAKYLSKQGKLK